MFKGAEFYDDWYWTYITERLRNGTNRLVFLGANWKKDHYGDKNYPPNLMNLFIQVNQR